MFLLIFAFTLPEGKWIEKYAFNISFYQDVNTNMELQNQTIEAYTLYNIHSLFLIELQSFQISYPLLRNANESSYYYELGILFPVNKKLKFKIKRVQGTFQSPMYRIGFSLDL